MHQMVNKYVEIPTNTWPNTHSLRWRQGRVNLFYIINEQSLKMSRKIFVEFKYLRNNELFKYIYNVN